MTSRDILRRAALLLLALTFAVPAMHSQESVAPAAATPSKAEEPVTLAKNETSTRKTQEEDLGNDTPRVTSRSRRIAKPSPKATPVPAATPPPKKPGFIRRIFGSGRKAATPAPAATTPTPAPSAIRTRRTKRADDDDESPAKRDDRKKPEKQAPEKVDEAEPSTTPKTEEERPKTTTGRGSKRAGKPAKAAATGENSDLASERQALETATASGDSGAIEKAKYNLARAQALEDPEVRELKTKADSATSEEESRKALRTYNRTLFDKIRKLEPEIKERADSMEAAVLKRLGDSEG